MALSERAAAALLARYMVRYGRLIALGGTAVGAAWNQLDSFTEADIARFRAAALPAVTEVSTRSAALSAGYLGVLLDQPIPAAPPAVVEPDWRGPFTHMWAALGRGESRDLAIQSGLARAEAAGQNAIASTARRVGDSIESDAITGWRRVPDGDACEWCRTVATQTYTSATSADFGHDRCGCAVSPILR